MKKNDAQIILRNVPHKGIDDFRELGRELVKAEIPADLVAWAIRYLKEEVIDVQSPNTFEAKRRDLARFIEWYTQMNGHALIEEWTPRDTQAFLNSLEKEGLAPTTVNRVFRTLRRFASWSAEQDDCPFRRLPTKGIKELTVDEPPARKIDRKDVFALFKAADNLVITQTRKNARPRRNRAILAVLYFTGLRVSELTRLTLDQYDGKRFDLVVRKGKVRSKVFIPSDCRKLLEDYLEAERPLDDPDGQSPALFLSAQSGKSLDRYQVDHVLKQIAQEANKHRKDRIEIHPHRLRHTFGAEIRGKTGSDTETAALLGHSGLKYVGRYARATEEEREAVLESLKVEGG